MRWEGNVHVQIAGSGAYEWGRHIGLVGRNWLLPWRERRFENLRMVSVILNRAWELDIEFALWSDDPVYNSMQAVLLATRSLVHLPRQDLLRTMKVYISAEPRDPDAWWRDA